MKVWMRLSFVFLATWIVGCSGDNGIGSSNDGFDRQAMLKNWADNIIVPGYENYVASLQTLNSRTSTFTSSPSSETLSDLRAAWLEAYLNWQAVAMFEIGKAEEITLINYTNIYPLDEVAMEQTIESGEYDLTSVNRQDEQGFPAIEYLIYAVRETDQEIVDLYSQEMANHPHKIYLKDLTDRLLNLSNEVLEDWKSGYNDTFVNNDGSESTSSVNKLINDYIFYFEKHLRAGKIGIPAGVFSASTLPQNVEGRFSGKSRELFMAGVETAQNFFNGKATNSNLPVEGESLRSYLDYLNTIKEGEDLSSLINDQFDQIKSVAESLNEDFQIQVENNNSKMLSTYDELQMNVILLKVDMLQALNVRVDYVDADGD